MDTILEIKNVYKIYGPKPEKILKELEANDADKSEIFKNSGHTVGLSDVSFSVNRDEIFVVMGLSGSGKSTLVRCINRLITPTDGEIILDGEDITKVKHKILNKIRREKIAMVFQSFALLPHRNIVDNVAFGLEIQKIPKKQRKQIASEMLKTVGLEGYDEMMPSELSGGMRQRVGLARALCTKPEILLMDEAFSALDPLIRTEMQDELISLQQKMHKTIVFITHDLDEALKIGDRIAIMKDGKIVQIGTPEDILKNPADDYVSEFTHNVNRARVITAASIMKKTVQLIVPKEGLHTALKKMKDNSISSLFVSDKDKKLIGIVTIDDVQNQLKKEDGSIEAIIQNVNKVEENTVIDEVMPLFLSSSFPVAVVEEDGTFKGILSKALVIGGIIGEEA